MPSDYRTVDIARDAAAFANSRFGKHYLKRLKKSHARALRVTLDKSYSDSYRANSASEAAVYASELEYFEIAHSIASNPSLVRRLAAKFIGKEGGDTEV